MKIKLRHQWNVSHTFRITNISSFTSYLALVSTCLIYCLNIYWSIFILFVKYIVSYCCFQSWEFSQEKTVSGTWIRIVHSFQKRLNGRHSINNLCLLPESFYSKFNWSHIEGVTIMWVNGLCIMEMNNVTKHSKCILCGSGYRFRMW